LNAPLQLLDDGWYRSLMLHEHSDKPLVVSFREDSLEFSIQRDARLAMTPNPVHNRSDIGSEPIDHPLIEVPFLEPFLNAIGIAPANDMSVAPRRHD
jgi:hypothetical protein